jgi:hypothetical protein
MQHRLSVKKTRPLIFKLELYENLRPQTETERVCRPCGFSREFFKLEMSYKIVPRQNR